MTRKYFFSFLVFILVACLFLPPALMSAQDKGRETIELYGGEKDGPVKFAHHKHQKRIPDCKACHKTFPQKKGAIEAGKQAETLKKKQVMNKICIKCHRQKKADGSRKGPFKCKECHIKPAA